MLNRSFRRYSPALILLMCLQAAAQQPPSPQSGIMNQAEAAMSSGKVAEAIKLYKQANKASGDKCSPCYRQLAIGYLKQGNSGEALKSCEKAVATASDDSERADGYSVRGEVLLALAGADATKLKGAEADFRAAIQQYPQRAVYRARLGLALLRQKRDAEGISELQAYLATGPDAASAAQVSEWIENPRRARESFAPRFTLITLSGETISADDLKGKTVVLDFWATWCPECVESLPELNDLHKRYQGDKLVVISISADRNEQAWRNFIAKKNMDWPQYWDRDFKITELFQVRGYPTYVIIDGEGIIRERIEGRDPQHSLAFRLHKKLEALNGLP